MIFNLSGEKYDYTKFNDQVREFGFPDHHAPPLKFLLDIILDIDDWTSKDPDNHIAVIHCLAGRSRTGVIVCCYLLFSHYFDDANEAIEYFNFTRSKGGENVVLPSQLRFIHYFATLLQNVRINDITPVTNPKKLILEKIIITPPLKLDGKHHGGSITPIVRVMHLTKDGGNKIQDVVFPAIYAKKETSNILNLNVEISGDILIKIIHHAKSPASYTKLLAKIHDSMTRIKRAPKYPFLLLFRVSFHTSFVPEHLPLVPNELDAVYAGKLITNHKLPEDMRVEFVFTTVEDYMKKVEKEEIIEKKKEENNIITIDQNVKTGIQPPKQQLVSPPPLNEQPPPFNEHPPNTSYGNTYSYPNRYPQLNQYNQMGNRIVQQPYGNMNYQNNTLQPQNNTLQPQNIYPILQNNFINQHREIYNPNLNFGMVHQFVPRNYHKPPLRYYF